MIFGTVLINPQEFYESVNRVEVGKKITALICSASALDVSIASELILEYSELIRNFSKFAD